MQYIKRFEDKLPLYLKKCDNNEIVNFPDIYIEGSVIKGVANQLRRWPNHLFVSFVVACLVISGIAFLAFTTMMLYSPAVADDNCCKLERYGSKHFFNVYFVKEETQIWSGKDLCYIEATAREHPKLNIHMINLLRNFNTLNITNTHFKMALITKYTNIHINDFPVDTFFSRLPSPPTAKNLSNELLLMAAKAYLLWNSPGIAINPRTYCNLSGINKLLYKEQRKDRSPTEFATIDLSMDLQATEVHCQAFIGFLLQEILTNTTQIYSMKDILDKYCPRIDNCPEVQVLNLKSQCLTDGVSDCPIIYSFGHSHNLIT